MPRARRGVRAWRRGVRHRGSTLKGDTSVVFNCRGKTSRSAPGHTAGRAQCVGGQGGGCNVPEDAMSANVVLTQPSGQEHVGSDVGEVGEPPANRGGLTIPAPKDDMGLSTGSVAAKPFTYSIASLMAAARSTTPAKPGPVATAEVVGGGDEAQKALDPCSLASAREMDAPDVDPLGEHNIGFQILLVMGWKPGKGLGPKHNGIRKPIRLEREEQIYTREGREGLAHASERNPFKARERSLAELDQWEIEEKTADWMKGSRSSHWVAAGTLDDCKKSAPDNPGGRASSPAFTKYVDAWDDRTYSELVEARGGREERDVSIGSEPESPVATWEDVWAEGVNDSLDKSSLNAELFFSCCVVPGDLVKMLHIEATGEIFESKVWAASGRELRQVLEHRLQGRVRVLTPTHIGSLHLFAVTQKASGDDEGILNAEASRSQGHRLFGNVFLVCRGQGRRVRNYNLQDYLRDFPPV